jgi:uncharacterized protein YdhG (YjbR/CyaY superfamily)
MRSGAATVDDYLATLPPDRKSAIEQLRAVLKRNLPAGFVEGMSYGMPGFVVPHQLYPDGYHCDPKLPLPFINFASQKNFIAFYHMGLYANPELLQWFKTNYAESGAPKLDMGKSCVRFKKPQTIPFKLIGELAKKLSVKDWISCYEKGLKRST